jgi:hypothetical protein
MACSDFHSLMKAAHGRFGVGWIRKRGDVIKYQEGESVDPSSTVGGKFFSSFQPRCPISRKREIIRERRGEFREREGLGEGLGGVYYLRKDRRCRLSQADP